MFFFLCAQQAQGVGGKAKGNSNSSLTFAFKWWVRGGCGSGGGADQRGGKVGGRLN